MSSDESESDVEEILALDEQMRVCLEMTREVDRNECLRNLVGEVMQKFAERKDKKGNMVHLEALAQEIVPFLLEHHTKYEAVDLLLEVERPDLLLYHVDSTNYKRVCLYLANIARYLPGPDCTMALDVMVKLYVKYKEYSMALRIALFHNSTEDVVKVFSCCGDLLQMKQLCYFIARHGIKLVMDENYENWKEMQGIIDNTWLSEAYLTVARDMEVMEPKSPEDVYKEHLLDGLERTSTIVDSAIQNLAGTFVNAFVNAGFGQDTLMIIQSESSGASSSENWVLKNKRVGKTTAVASLGMILLWDVECGLPQIKKYFESDDIYVIVGALLGIGILACRVPHKRIRVAAFSPFVHHEAPSLKIGAIMGLGLAYANSYSPQVYGILRHILEPNEGDNKMPLKVIAFTAVTLGLVYVGSCDDEVAETIIGALRGLSESEMGDPLTRLLPLGLGLLYLGKQEKVEKVSESFHQKIRMFCDNTLLSCAYAGTGNVLKVQHLLNQCGQHVEEGEIHHGPAVLGIAMVAMAEEVGIEMSIRSLEHLLRYGERCIRSAVPLALGLLCISNPKVSVVNTLRRLSHDADRALARAAIISLGLIGAGTNDTGIADMLRKLSSSYSREPTLFLCVRIAQGLVHLGKGLLTLSPCYSERFLLSPISLAGIVTVLHMCLDLEILFTDVNALYFLALAIQPRMLMTVDENLKSLVVPVRVGRAVEVNRPGQSKTITGIMNRSTPVVLAAEEKAELSTDKYIPLIPILESVVILKQNTEYNEEH